MNSSGSTMGDNEEEEVLRLDLGEVMSVKSSSRCFIGKVLSRKAFNAFGFLEAMKRAMALTRGFTAREINKNLFLFQFNSEADMRAVLNREPWLFEKNVVILKELGSGEQPSSIALCMTPLWVCVYDLPMVARNKNSISLIVGRIGELVEVDQTSLEGFSRSVRIKIKIDIQKPLKKGLTLDLGASKIVWIEFKYERLPSFCYICGTLGHLRKDCDLVEGVCWARSPAVSQPHRARERPERQVWQGIRSVGDAAIKAIG
ncbi:hypothetical protein ACS0TY_013669 [Phlomoides rotata]